MLIKGVYAESLPKEVNYEVKFNLKKPVVS
jgi:hypothetical protein